MAASKSIFWSEEIGKGNTYIVRKKFANLGEMIQVGMPVPLGFAVSIDRHRKFMLEKVAWGELSHYVLSRGREIFIEGWNFLEPAFLLIPPPFSRRLELEGRETLRHDK